MIQERVTSFGISEPSGGVTMEELHSEKKSIILP
jgi:hypothetical protein